MKSTRICSILFGLGLFALAVLAQTPGTFAPTGNMTTSRSSPTATLLNDGRVLIAGGDIIDAPTFATQSSAELYDPRSGTFTATGNMMTPRSEHTATLLPDGRVLITGGGVTGARGVSGATSFASAELYDPETGTFSATGDMTTARVGSTATLLNNGKVLIAGGFQRDPATLNVLLLARAELYDPSTGTFTATGEMTTEWADTATLLPNGRVLITRGNPEGPPPFLSSADLYDPSTGTFTSAGYLTVNHTGPTATLLLNGKVLIAGGDINDGEGGTNIAELYDPAAGAFSRTGNMTTGREQDTATLLPDGRVLIAGPGLSAELYDPSTGAFSATGSMTTDLFFSTATLLTNGTVLIAGGTGGEGLASAELYCPVNVNCPPDPWQQAIAAMKTAAGTDNLNFYQWAWYWQTLPAFSGAPAGFGVAASISPVVMEQITVAGGGNPLLNVPAEQWVLYFRQVVP